MLSGSIRAAIASLLVFSIVGVASASFHLMQIERLCVGLDGDTSVQAVQLRMRSSLQNFVSGTRLVVRNATGRNPVELISFPGNVVNHGAGVRILVGSAGFAAVGGTPDFVMTNLIPDSYFAAGSLSFENSLGTQVLWRLSWGGAGYSGSTTGTLDNDADGQFAPNYGVALDPSAAFLVRFSGTETALSTNNLADYVTNAGTSATFTNNAGASFVLESAPTASPIGVGAGSRILAAAPNPFGDHTRIHLSQERSGDVRVQVYDVQGRLVGDVYDGFLSDGLHELPWSAVGSDGARLASGVYFARLRSGAEISTQKLIVTR